MSTEKIASVLHAFRAIESAPDEALQAYNVEVSMVFQKLRKLIARKDKLVPRPDTSDSTIRQVFLG